MREIRTSGSEGGGAGEPALPTPYQGEHPIRDPDPCGGRGRPARCLDDGLALPECTHPRDDSSLGLRLRPAGETPAVPGMATEP